MNLSLPMYRMFFTASTLLSQALRADDGLTMDEFITICVFIMIAIQIVIALCVSIGLQILLWIYRKCSIPHSSTEIINLNPREYQGP